MYLSGGVRLGAGGGLRLLGGRGVMTDLTGGLVLKEEIDRGTRLSGGLVAFVGMTARGVDFTDTGFCGLRLGGGREEGTLCDGGGNLVVKRGGLALEAGELRGIGDARRDGGELSFVAIGGDL